MKTEQQKQPKGLGPAKKVAAVLGACTTMACSGPQSQVRAEPPAEPCPPDAAQAMAELNINIGAKKDALFTSGRGGRFMSVREGGTSLEIQGRWGKLPGGSIVKGRLVFGGERVYGRLTQAQEYEADGVYGRTWPICLDLLDETGHRGIEMESGSTADTARVLNSAEVKAVESFK